MPDETSGEARCRTSVHYAIAYGGDDPNNATVLEYDDEAGAAEMTQWIRDGYVAWCTVTRSRWQRADAMPPPEIPPDLVLVNRDDLVCDHGPDELCFDCATDEQLAAAVPPAKGASRA